MGYTRYWNKTEKPMTEDFVEFCREVINTSNKLGIKICGWDGFGEPIISTECIRFNGDGENELDHETFSLDNERTGFNFCKTARKPYDYTVRTILREAFVRGYINELSDDGINEEIISDEDFVAMRC